MFTCKDADLQKAYKQGSVCQTLKKFYCELVKISPGKWTIWFPD